MNKKKLITMLVALTLIAAMGVGATLAYFTDTTELTNVVTMGKVEGLLVENDVKKDTNNKWILDKAAKPIKEDGIDKYVGVMPGDTVQKNPTVVLEKNSSDAYVRVTFDVTSKVPGDDWLNKPAYQEWVGSYWSGHKEDVSYKKAIINSINSEIAKNNKWVKTKINNIVYYYYTDKLTADSNFEPETIGCIDALQEGITKATLFDKFTIPTKFKNAAASQGFNIEVKADLMQADNVKFLNDGYGVRWVNKDNWYETITEVENYVEPTAAE